MSFHWTDNDLDNSLFAELSKEKPDEEYIRKLIDKDANINSIECNDDSVLMDAISKIQDGLDLKYIQLIIDLGADLNYTDEGFNCLFDACLTRNIDLVEMLLKGGADPNCTSTELAESLLDWAIFDQWFGENENRDGGESMMKIVQLLKEYGARPISEIFAKKPEQFLKVFAGYKTGLYTANGFLKVENIPNIDQKTIKSFWEWVSSNPDKWTEYETDDGVRIKNPPDLSVLREHNAQGLLFAKQIKLLLKENILLNYYFVKADDLEKHHVRNVEHIAVE